MTRTFEDYEAIRDAVPLIAGLVGPSGSGKTYSAMRLATGMQRITGGDIYGIDTEARRMLHYADEFKFRHIPFVAPFDPLSYLAAFEHCVRKGAKTIITDSASHIHEGPGGTLEAHEEELDRLAGDDDSKRKRYNLTAWQKPKGELRRFLNTILQMNINIIFCYRAKDKLKVVSGQNPTPLGYMPIAGDEMIYEATVNCLLLPGAKGVPTWHPREMGERALVKLPEMFKDVFIQGQPLSEEVGEKLAIWAAGSSYKRPVEPVKPTPYQDVVNEMARFAKEDWTAKGNPGDPFELKALHKFILDWAIAEKHTTPPEKMMQKLVYERLESAFETAPDQTKAAVGRFIENALSLPPE